MRYCLYILIFAVVSSCSHSGQLHVITFNSGSSIISDTINTWENRLPIIQQYFKNQNPDIIGMQQVNFKRLRSLSTILPAYSYIVSQDIDEADEDQLNPIFYKTDKFRILAKSRFYISGEGIITQKDLVTCNQIHLITWSKLESIESGHIFFIFNVHFCKDNDDEDIISSALFLKRVRELAGNAPVIVTGSFHMNEASRTYRIIRSNWDRFLSIENSSELAKSGKNQKYPSYNAYGEEGMAAMSDYIFVNSYFDVRRSETHRIKKQNVYISDYYPVSVNLKFLFNRRMRQGNITELPWRNQ
ncbi:exonuclease/endonuclease/phosphatase family protein [Natronoflexus pectinivorans]|uniref:Endonuclease/exonuclease/phosphatase family metal-dependent hydrolase n=1 Tax=Natronoflexus pectinivorans TaxID=682526 RepID=A0A4R2GQC0_9BACT|nr:hypothetical protein [Natronoflexus pectinivorans]TCO10919.1 endonuclease/exonuclease/phosphatase family metal-dependent hydrolase [Natronoflexus pectinivorans]